MGNRNLLLNTVFALALCTPVIAADPTTKPSAPPTISSDGLKKNSQYKSWEGYPLGSFVIYEEVPKSGSATSIKAVLTARNDSRLSFELAVTPPKSPVRKINGPGNPTISGRLSSVAPPVPAVPVRLLPVVQSAVPSHPAAAQDADSLMIQGTLRETGKESITLNGTSYNCVVYDADAVNFSYYASPNGSSAGGEPFAGKVWLSPAAPGRLVKAEGSLTPVPTPLEKAQGILNKPKIPVTIQLKTISKAKQDTLAGTALASTTQSVYDALTKLNQPRQQEPTGRQTYIVAHADLKNAMTSLIAAAKALANNPADDTASRFHASMKSAIAAVPNDQKVASDDLKNRLEGIATEINLIDSIQDISSSRVASLQLMPKNIIFEGAYVWTHDSSGKLIPVPDGKYGGPGMSSLVVAGGKHIIISN